jgi:hypothetical protein
MVVAVLAAAPAWGQTSTSPSGTNANPPNKAGASHSGSSMPSATSGSSTRSQRTLPATNAETRRLNQQELKRLGESAP